MKKFIKYAIIVIFGGAIIGYLRNSGNDTEIKASQSAKISLTTNEVKVVNFIINDDITSAFDGKKSVFKIPHIFVTSVDMRKVYSQNEVKGDSTYKGKSIVISGVVSEISSNFGDEPVVMLRSGNSFEPVHLNFKDGYKNIIANLNKGQRVRFSCVGDGEVIGSPMLKNCETIDAAILNEVGRKYSLVNRYLEKGISEDKDIIKVVDLAKGLGKAGGDFSSCNEINNACLMSEVGKIKKYETNDPDLVKLKESLK